LLAIIGCITPAASDGYKDSVPSEFITVKSPDVPTIIPTDKPCAKSVSSVTTTDFVALPPDICTFPISFTPAGIGSDKVTFGFDIASVPLTQSDTFFQISLNSPNVMLAMLLILHYKI